MTTIAIVRDQDGHLRGIGEKNQRAYARMRKMLAELEIGECVEFSYWFPRNGRLHGKHFALLAAVFDAQEAFADPEQFRMWAQVGAGHCDFFPGPNGKVVAIPKSISFKSIDDADFAEHHMKVIEFFRSMRCTRLLWPHLSDTDAGEAMNGILQGFERE